MRKINYAFWVITIFFISLIIYAGFIEPNRLVIRQENLFLPYWQIQDFKIGVISDIHIGTKFVDINKLEKVVNAVNSQNPDLIVFLGDLEGRYIAKSKPDEVTNVLKQLKAKYGVVSILGNHDFYPPSTVKNILKNANIPVLENESMIISTEPKFKLIGLKDMWHYKFNPDDVIGKTDIPTIVLSHNPDYFPQISSNVSLTLSGHTHGGEVYFPFLGAPFVPSKYNQKYRKGYIVENNKHLYVTSGIATLSRFRLFNPPEIVILTLNKQAKNNITNNTSVKQGYIKNHFKVPNSLR